MGGSSSTVASSMAAGGHSNAGLAVFLLFLLLGGGLIAFGLIFYNRGNKRFAASSGWLTVDALVKMARVDKHTHTVNGSIQTSYRPQALYSYQAGGAEREGKRVYLVSRTDWRTRGEGEAWLAACPVGGTVKILYDPANPDDSAMIRNKPSLWMAIVLCGTGAFLLIMGLFVLVRMMAG